MNENEIGISARVDNICQPLSTEFLEHNGYIRVLTPDFPGYWDGNYLILKKPPGPSAISSWIETWYSEFRDFPSVKKLTLRWEVLSGQHVMKTEDLDPNMGMEMNFEQVLTLHSPTQPRRSIQNFSLREVIDDADWDIVTKIGLQEIDPNDTQRVDYWYHRIVKFRQSVDAGRGQWWLAEVGGYGIGSAGFFFNATLARFQEVTVIEGWRKQGVASALVFHVSTMFLATYPKATIVIAAEPNTQAERIYMRLGFYPVCQQVSIIGNRRD